MRVALWLKVILFRLFGKRYLAQECGHKTLVVDVVSAFGEKIVCSLILRDGKVEYCHQCLAGMASRCARCGKPIFVGDPVTLYSPKEGVKVPEYSVVYQQEPLMVVGCLRIDCADTGADRAGFWIPPGQVLRFESPLGKLF